MKKLFIFIAVAIGLTCCGLLPTYTTVVCSGPVQEVAMEKIKNFSEVTIDSPADVTFRQADRYDVVVRANQEVFDYLDYRTIGRNFSIANQRYVTIVPEVYEVLVQAPWFSKMTVNGVADIWMTEGYVSQTNLSVVVNGTANIDFIGVSVPVLDIEVNGTAKIDLTDIFADKLYITLNGSGSVVISGMADEAFLAIAGTGHIDAKYLDCTNIDQRVTGSGTIKL